MTYAYDAAGNRTAKTESGATTTYTLGVGDRLASWTGGSYTYDSAGNVTRIERDGRPALDLTWNSQYQLVSVSTNGVFAEGYAYDALGRRVSTTTLEGTTRHVYDSSWQVIADLDEDGNVVASYTWGEGIDSLLAVNVGGESYYPLTDIQGTVWGYADSQNNVVARWQYDAWGNVVDEYVSVPVLAKLRYRFQCRERSAATGLVNFRMRWYDAETGRWLSKDPIGLSGGLNLYAFCGNCPLIFIDPFGCTLGTEYGEFALKYYIDVIDDPNAKPWLRKISYVGGCLSALWTKETYCKTTLVLVTSYKLHRIAYIDIRLSRKPKLQIRDQKKEPIFRIERAPFGSGAERGKDRWHYHRLPDMGKHRPYEGW